MTTITLKINERTKAGKALLSMLEFFTKESKGVEVIETPYDPEFVAMVKKSAASKKKKEVNPDDVWGSLGLK
ncbi:hypothetical protein AM493_09115 [Flavobacterium akiainvivens]|uniref:Uncharacterized protein n=1 Tax=Flavobacterium akiainvivens TaxID=1202724 RepID=A0A0N0RQN2_9FLAO|nr:DUF2683 family protein [Flavobacterium akiainvivens]KOS06172.1 hypothetical protein AM493_09115 [Flavobacterium akiainvivens]SFQ68235.1 hypothetical protein SAMN05444144_11457 [Flavobacterium akiainvivens]